METFSALRAICAGNGQWRGALMFSLICVWINGWVNNREAGDLRRPRAHYDVIVMTIIGAKAACDYCDNGTTACLPNIFIYISIFCNIYGFVQIFTRHQLCWYNSMIYPREIPSFNSKEYIMHVIISIHKFHVVNIYIYIYDETLISSYSMI